LEFPHRTRLRKIKEKWNKWSLAEGFGLAQKPPTGRLREILLKPKTPRNNEVPKKKRKVSAWKPGGREIQKRRLNLRPKGRDVRGGVLSEGGI